MARHPESPSSAKSSRTRLACTRENHRRPSLGDELIGPRLCGGPSRLAVHIEKCLGRGATGTSIAALLATGRDKDRAVQTAFVPARHSWSPWLLERRGVSVTREKSR